MVRFGARVALSASFLVAAGFVGFVPVSPPRCHKSLMPASVAEATAPEARRDVPTGVPVVMAVLAGLVVAFAMPPKALAQPGGLPDFSVVRPGYMQGIDAANAATKPGEIDSGLIRESFCLVLYSLVFDKCAVLFFQGLGFRAQAQPRTSSPVHALRPPSSHRQSKSFRRRKLPSRRMPPPRRSVCKGTGSRRKLTVRVRQLSSLGACP